VWRRADASVHPALAGCCALLAVVHAVAAADEQAAPLVFGGWAILVLALPDGRWRGPARKALAAAAAAGALAWTVTLEVDGGTVTRLGFLPATAAVAVLGATSSVLRYPRSSAEHKRLIRWMAAASLLVTTYVGTCSALDVMTGSPQPLGTWVAAGFVILPVGQSFAVLAGSPRASAVAVVEAMSLAGLAALVVVTYLVVVVGINGAPQGHERDVLLASLAAALVVAALAVPVRRRVTGFAARIVGDAEPSADEVVSGFSARMSRAVPMDELMLQLAESLRASVADAGAEIWTGAGGVLTRAVSVPTQPAARMGLGERERVVVGRARSGGPSWSAVWLPELPQVAGRDLRVLPVAHLGELLGLIVVRRGEDAALFTDDEERALVEVARQLGLALHNVRLDSALQASLAELAQRNEELQASRLRIVTAADSSRRAIERNLHDGAQQHLVALAVKIGLARAIAEEGDTQTVLTLLDDLRGDVQTTIGELRELAHGIYPPLLRDRGLGEALRTAATRSPLPCTVEIDLPGRFEEAVETAAYFCSLEAMQNAGKYAGPDATITVRITSDGESLCCELSDDGAGFDPATAVEGHGFQNMQDRLGAIGGTLRFESTPGCGTTVRAVIPARPLPVSQPAAQPVGGVGA
jgi:signal transduction histidine kinase